MNTIENNTEATATETAVVAPIVTTPKKYAFTTVVVNDERRAEYTKVRDELNTTDKLLFEAIWQNTNFEAVKVAISTYNDKVAAEKAAAKAAKAKPAKEPKAAKVVEAVAPAAPTNEDAPREVIVEFPEEEAEAPEAVVPDKIAAKKAPAKKTPGQAAAEVAAKKTAAAKKAPAKKK